MSARNTDRAAAIVTYLNTALNPGTTPTYYVARSVSQANGAGNRNRIVLVRWYRREPEGAMNINEDRADRLYFSIIGLPVCTGDQYMDEECDQIEEDILDAIRASTAYSVFNSLDDGAYLGWRVTGSVKGPNQTGQLAVEVEVEVSVEEDAT